MQRKQLAEFIADCRMRAVDLRSKSTRNWSSASGLDVHTGESSEAVDAIDAAKLLDASGEVTLCDEMIELDEYGLPDNALPPIERVGRHAVHAALAQSARATHS